MANAEHASEPGRVGRFMNWLGYGPEGNGEPQPKDAPPAEEPAPEQSAPHTAPPAPPDTPAAAAASTSASGTDLTAKGPAPSAEEWRAPADLQSAAPTDTQTTEERIRLAAASAAEAAEQRAVDEIVALEEDLERAKQEAAERLRELEAARATIESELAETRRQLAEERDRAVAAERRATEIEAERERERRLQAIEGDNEPAAERIGPAEEVTKPAEEVTQPEEIAEPEEVTKPAEEVTERDEVSGAGQVSFRSPGAVISLSEATLDDLRLLGMSVTQAKRVLDYRQRLGGFDSVDDLDFVPGFPKTFLSKVKARVTL